MFKNNSTWAQQFTQNVTLCIWARQWLGMMSNYVLGAAARQKSDIQKQLKQKNE